MKTAEQPFYFNTASYVTCVSEIRATTIEQLSAGVKAASDASIFNHTFQSLGRYHFLTEGFSNDFAQWVLASCNRAGLAEELAGLDIRKYTQIDDLRKDLVRVFDQYCASNRAYAVQEAFEPFYFCESIEVTVHMGVTASTLQEFRHGLESLSHAAFQHHFLTSRLRLHELTNDFSWWFEKQLGLATLARRVNRIDVYTNTIESAKASMLALVDKELAS
ncbi:MAG TPA: DUF5752 family protein [Terriglobia bacterium]|nr:DUF5752 family protein [Terriglobia bacterium]